MLSQLIQLLEENDGEVNLADLSRWLDAQPSAVSGMMETLIRKGRVIEIRPECGICDTCSLIDDCRLPARLIKRYRVIERRSAG